MMVVPFGKVNSLGHNMILLDGLRALAKLARSHLHHPVLYCQCEYGEGQGPSLPLGWGYLIKRPKGKNIYIYIYSSAPCNF